MGENEPPAVDDVWKASAYGDLEKLTKYVDEDPALVNAQDATGYVRHARVLPAPTSLFARLPADLSRAPFVDAVGNLDGSFPFNRNSRSRAAPRLPSPKPPNAGSVLYSGPR